MVTPPFGTVEERLRATSSTVGPITSRWSGRTLVITPIVECMIWCSAVFCRSGRTAMHSMIIAWAFSRRARSKIVICSQMFGVERRTTGSSLPSGRIRRAFEPVTLATVRIPPSRSAAAIRRVTEDLPRLPLTWTRIGIACRARRCRRVSSVQYPRTTARRIKRTNTRPPAGQRGARSGPAPFPSRTRQNLA